MHPNHHYYDGCLKPDYGQVLYDLEEDAWVTRLADADEPFSCGVDCCGIETQAVAAFDTEDRARTAAAAPSTKARALAATEVPAGVPGACWACGNCCSPVEDWTCPHCHVVYPAVTP